MAKSPQASVVAVLNMKGGVGKTIVSANVFREVFVRRHLDTLLVDFDAQFNLSQLLLTRAEYDGFKADKRTIYHVLEPPTPETVFAVSEADMADVGELEKYLAELESYAGPPTKTLHLLPGDFRLARMNIREQPALRIPRRRFENFIRTARDKYQLIVLDCNPSSSFITRCALEAATHLLIPVRADKFSVMGVEILSEFLKQMPTLLPHLKVMIVINDLSDKSDDAALAELRAHPEFGPKILVEPIKHSEFFKAKTDYTGFATDRRVANWTKIAGLMATVADEVAGMMGLP